MSPVDLRRIRQVYSEGRFTILDGVDLDVPAKEMVEIVQRLLAHIEHLVNRSIQSIPLCQELQAIGAGTLVGGQDPVRIRKEVVRVADALLGRHEAEDIRVRDIVYLHDEGERHGARSKYAGQIGTVCEVEKDGSAKIFRHDERCLTLFLEPLRWMRVIHRPPEAQ